LFSRRRAKYIAKNAGVNKAAPIRFRRPRLRSPRNQLFWKSVNQSITVTVRCEACAAPGRKPIRISATTTSTENSMAVPATV
jgi:hypothetical protein